MTTRLHPIELEAAKQVAETYTFGDVISHDQIDSLLGTRVPDAPVTPAKFQELSLTKLARLESMKEALLENSNMLLISVRGQGYRICQPSEQTSVAMDVCQKRLGKSLRRAAKALINIQVDMLEQSEIQKNIDARGRLGMIANMTARSKMLRGVTLELLEKKAS